jgi:uncharacterized membrane protein YhaH (DUF805 family)
MLYVSMHNYANRLRDKQKSPWLALLVFVPIVNMGLLIYCGFIE